MGRTVEQFLADFDDDSEDWDAARHLNLVHMGAEFLRDQANDDTWPRVIYRAMFRGLRKSILAAEEQFFSSDLDELDDFEGDT